MACAPLNLVRKRASVILVSPGSIVSIAMNCSAKIKAFAKKINSELLDANVQKILRGFDVKIAHVKVSAVVMVNVQYIPEVQNVIAIKAIGGDNAIVMNARITVKMMANAASHQKMRKSANACRITREFDVKRKETIHKRRPAIATIFYVKMAALAMLSRTKRIAIVPHSMQEMIVE